MPGNGKAPAKSLPKLKDEIQFQTRPRRQWVIVEELGHQNGGGNAGIAKVEAKDDPYDRYFIEKRFKAEHVEWRVPHKEIALLRQLGDHPNILKMFDYFIDEQKKKASVYLEYCDAGDLEAVLIASRQDRVPERKIWKWFMGLIDALVYCHRGPDPDDDRKVLLYWNVIWHRDIKPPNIFLKTDRQKGEVVAKLADFGFSESVHMAYESKKKADVSLSEAYTPGFEPPEHPEYTGATDVWQLALCIACVCAGNLNPWSKENPLGKRWDRDQPAGPHYSKELNDILSWCLNDDKTRRPTPMQIAKRLKEMYVRVKTSLPPDPQPMAVPGRQSKQAAQTPNASSPGPHGADQRQKQRPNLPAHAFSNPEMEMNGQRGNRYQNLVQDQRSPYSPGTANQIIHEGGGTPYGGLPGGFTPGYGQGYGSGYGRDGYFGRGGTSSDRNGRRRY